MTTGEVKILHDNRVMSTRRYKSRPHLKKILKYWEDLYGTKKYELLITPDAPEFEKSITHYAKSINKKYRDARQKADVTSLDKMDIIQAIPEVTKSSCDR